MREDVSLEQMLLTVEGELFGADGAHLPVALHMLLEAALLKVRREDNLAERAALVDISAGIKAEAAPGLSAVPGLSSTCCLLWGMLCGLRGAGAAGRLHTDHLLVPAWSRL